MSVSFIPSSASSVPTALRLLTNGEPDGKLDEARASAILAEEDLTVEIDLGDGEEEARVWTCDFSYVSCDAVGNLEADILPGVRHHQRQCRILFSACAAFADNPAVPDLARRVLLGRIIYLRIEMPGLLEY